MALLHHGVVGALQQELACVQVIPRACLLAQLVAWKNFTALLQERSQLRTTFDAEDWRHTSTAYPNHRDICSSENLGLTINAPNDQNLTRTERAFLRAVLDREYNIHMATTIYPVQVHFITQSPEAPFCTLFDYSTGSLKIIVEAALTSETGARFGGNTDLCTSMHRYFGPCFKSLQRPPLRLPLLPPLRCVTVTV
ncbi:hypothetical protein C8R46DRAFT_1221083 [Mycena filopes]|nr:hypothetical protein C8R46DRAFT_1221083 [Mycena filopes]